MIRALLYSNSVFNNNDNDNHNIEKPNKMPFYKPSVNCCLPASVTVFCNSGSGKAGMDEAELMLTGSSAFNIIRR